VKSKSKIKQEPAELVGLLESRFRQLGFGTDKPYNKPVEEPDPRVVKVYADANRSDPFAAKRIYLYLKQGYVLGSEIK
jgi:hypothetical protein